MAWQDPISEAQENLIKRLAGEHVPAPILKIVTDDLAADPKIDRKRASFLIDILKALEPAAPANGTPAPDMPAVPAGRYALMPQGEAKFYEVEIGKRGKWEGFVFLSELQGANHRPIKNPREKAPILEAIAANVEEAARRYGHYRNECGFCRKALTDRFSRFFGVGPVCRRNHGMPISEHQFRQQRPHTECAKLDRWLEEDIRINPDVKDPNEEWAEHKNEFARREAEQEQLAFEAKLERDMDLMMVTGLETPPYLA